MPHLVSEEQTRKEKIDPSTGSGRRPQLEKAGWILRAVQSVFLQKRHLEAADASTTLSASLYEPPLDMFGADAADRWFAEKEVEEVVGFVNRMAV